MKYNNSNPIGKIFLTLIIISVSTVLGYYLCYSEIIKIEKKEKNTSSQNTEYTIDKKEELEVLEIVSPTVINLIDMITNALEYPCGYDKIFKDNVVRAEDITLGDISRIMQYNLYKDYNKEKEGEKYTKNEIEDTIKKIFGTNLIYTHETINSCLPLVYDINDGTYKVGQDTCSRSCSGKRKLKVVKAIQEGENIYIYARVLFTKDDINNVYYSDYEKNNLIELEEKDKNNDDILYSKGKLYKLSFKMDAGTYVFASSEPILG